MSLQRRRPREMHFTEPSLGNYSVSLISNRLVPITPGYIIFYLSRKNEKENEIKRCNCLSVWQKCFPKLFKIYRFFNHGAATKELRINVKENIAIFGERNVKEWDRADKNEKGGKTIRWRYQEDQPDKDENEKKRWANIWVKQTSGIKIQTQILKQESSCDELDWMFLYFCSFSLRLFHVFQQHPTKISCH